MPTIWVLEEMRSILLIHEQINAILFGFTYKKNEDFFLSDKYDTLIEWLAEYERKDIIVEAEDEELDLNAPQETEQQLYTTKTSIKKKEGDSRKGIWDYRIRSFLIKSNEKWILDQFNLCKKFLNQNSIQGNYEDFLHPVYQYCYNDFKHFRILREKFLSNEKFNKFKGVSSPKSSSARSGISSSSNSLDSTALQGFEVFDLSVIKCDIWALLRAIEEIENKIRMNKILRRSHRKGKISTDQILSDEKSKDKFIRQNFSMLNFNRNFVAIEFAQKNPSDQRNKLHS